MARCARGFHAGPYASSSSPAYALSHTTIYGVIAPHFRRLFTGRSIMLNLRPGLYCAAVILTACLLVAATAAAQPVTMKIGHATHQGGVRQLGRHLQGRPRQEGRGPHQGGGLSAQPARGDTGHGAGRATRHHRDDDDAAGVPVRGGSALCGAVGSRHIRRSHARFPHRARSGVQEGVLVHRRCQGPQARQPDLRRADGLRHLDADP